MVSRAFIHFRDGIYQPNVQLSTPPDISVKLNSRLTGKDAHPTSGYSLFARLSSNNGMIKDVDMHLLSHREPWHMNVLKHSTNASGSPTSARCKTRRCTMAIDSPISNLQVSVAVIIFRCCEELTALPVSHLQLHGQDANSTSLRRANDPNIDIQLAVSLHAPEIEASNPSFEYIINVKVIEL
ncbi:hypothetical protein PM082_014766 [Marasmius tenuissimus]|nr:hypothetical protein PM082_014766 [Marasmius tenuissimus]